MIETERRNDPYASSAGSHTVTVNGADPQQSNHVNLVSYMPRPAYRFKPTLSAPPPENEGGYGRRLRRNLAQVRRHIDCVASTLNHMENRCWQKSGCPDERIFMQPHILYSTDSYPPIYTPDKPIDSITTKFVRSAMNKVKCPIYDVCWTPEGRRLITGASSGEFTLWNGTVFNFETILQAHDSAVRAMQWSHNDAWLATADHDGFVKYWQTNMNNVTMFQAHKEAVRSISFCPSDVKFATASDDGTVRVWDFLRCYEERILRGHGSDVRSVDWHPNKSLLVSGSRDSQQPVKLWDPKSGQCLATLHDHKNAVMAVQWNANGNWFLSASKDHLIKLYDIRMMKELSSFKGHKKEVTSISWHPIHEGLFVSGSADGAMMFWLVGNEREVGLMETAHEQAIWTLKWHPLGHILASGSNDNNTKFWTRNKPGDLLEDFFGMVSSSMYDQPSSSVVSGSSQSQRHQQSQAHANFPQADHQHNRHVETSPVKRDQFHSSHAGATNWPQQPANKAPVVPQAVQPGSNQNSNETTPLGASIPGLGGMDSSGLFRSRRDPRGSFPITQPPGGRKPLLKQPPPKRAQRQFERVWNVGSQFVPDYEEAPVVADPDYRQNVRQTGSNSRMPPDDEPQQRQPLLPPAPPSDWAVRPGGADTPSQRHAPFPNAGESPTSQHFVGGSPQMTSHYGTMPPTSKFTVGPPPAVSFAAGPTSTSHFAAGRALPLDAVPDSWDLGGDHEVDTGPPPAWGQVIMPPTMPSSSASSQLRFGDVDLRHAPTAAPQPPQWTGSGPPPFVSPPVPPTFPMPPAFPTGSGPPGGPPPTPRDPRAILKEPAGPMMPPYGPPVSGSSTQPRFGSPQNRDPRNVMRDNFSSNPDQQIPIDYNDPANRADFDPTGPDSAGRSPLVNPKRKWAEVYEAEEKTSVGVHGAPWGGQPTGDSGQWSAGPTGSTVAPSDQSSWGDGPTTEGDRRWNTESQDDVDDRHFQQHRHQNYSRPPPSHNRKRYI